MSDKGHHQIEAAADRYRSELLATLEELDRRRVEATNLRAQVKAHQTGILLAAGGAALIVGGMVTAGMLRRRYHNARLRRARVRGFIRAWQHPERVATQADYRPLPTELLRKFALVFGTVLATTYAKKSANLVAAKTR